MRCWWFFSYSSIKGMILFICGIILRRCCGQVHRRSSLVSVGVFFDWRKDYKSLTTVCVGTKLEIVYVVEGKTVTEKNIALLSLVMRIDEFGVLYFFKFLDFRFDDGVGGVWVYWFCTHGVKFRLSFLLGTNLRASAWLSSENLSS